MTTTFQVRVDETLKKEFLDASQKKWLEGSVLIRYFMKSFTENSDIINFDIEDNFFDGMMRDKVIVSKLEKIWNKLDTLWF